MDKLVDAQGADREQSEQLTAELKYIRLRLEEAAGRMSRNAYERLASRLETRQRKSPAFGQ